MSFKNSLLSVLLHVVELVVVVGVVWVVLSFFGVDAESTKLLVAVAVNAVVKFGRAYDKVPLPDYVN